MRQVRNKYNQTDLKKPDSLTLLDNIFRIIESIAFIFWMLAEFFPKHGFLYLAIVFALAGIVYVLSLKIISGNKVRLLIWAAYALVIIVFGFYDYDNFLPQPIKIEPLRSISLIQSNEFITTLKINTRRAEQQIEESNRLTKIQEATLQKEAKLQEERRQQSLETSISNHEAYQSRYLGEHNAHYSISVTVADENGQLNEFLGYILCTLLNTNGIITTASLFTTNFVADGLFDQMLGGSKEAFDGFELTNIVRTIVLARQSVEYSTNSTFDGTVTAKMTLKIRAFSTATFRLLFADNIIAIGAGFTQFEAQKMAEERILDKIKNGRLVENGFLTGSN